MFNIINFWYSESTKVSNW